MPRRGLALGMAMVAASAPTVVGAEEERSFGADVTLATDYVTRGVSQTLSRPALQASIGFAHQSGWSGYVWGSNVDYVADGDPDDGARVELDVVLEYEHALSERLAATVGRIQYFNPGLNPGYDYDYAEWTARMTLDQRHRLSAYYSDSVYGSGARALYLAATTGLEVPAGLWLEVEVGHFDLTHWGDAYHHASVSLSGEIEALAWRLAWHVTSRHASNSFYPSVVEPRAVLSLTYALW